MLRWPGAVFDQPNQNVYPAQATRSLNVSAGFEIESGAPLTVCAAHPIYGGGGEILTVRGAGFETSDGFRPRTPWTTPLSAGASHDFHFAARTLRASPST
jgi:hypothetical protein